MDAQPIFLMMLEVFELNIVELEEIVYFPGRQDLQIYLAKTYIYEVQ